MNRIKRKIRNKLLPDTLRELIVIDLVERKPGDWSINKLDEWFNYLVYVNALRILSNYFVKMLI